MPSGAREAATAAAYGGISSNSSGSYNNGSKSAREWKAMLPIETWEEGRAGVDEGNTTLRK